MQNAEGDIEERGGELAAISAKRWRRGVGQGWKTGSNLCNIQETICSGKLVAIYEE
jgi:hypothetical protein